MLRRLLEFQRDIFIASAKTTVRVVGGVTGIPGFLLPYIQGLYHEERDGTAHAFLTPEWVDAVHAIREEYRNRESITPPAAKGNLNVTGVPFGNGALAANLDSTSGEVEIALGHLPDPDLTITLDYELARKLLVDIDINAAMQAFMSGQIKVEGDVGKLLALQAAPVDPLALEVGARIQAVTLQ